MFHYEYVTADEAKPYRQEFLGVIHAVQGLLRDYFTFNYRFVGSSARNMITFDPSTNRGFDFDVDILINDDDENYSPKEIKTMIMRAIDQVARPMGFSPCVNHTRVITLKRNTSFLLPRIEYSCDFCIVNDYKDAGGHPYQEYIHFQKGQDRYMWNEQPGGYDLESRVEWIKAQNGDLWKDVRDLYLEKKNNNQNPDKKSRALYAETIHEICQKNGYYG